MVDDELQLELRSQVWLNSPRVAHEHAQIHDLMHKFLIASNGS